MKVCNDRFVMCFLTWMRNNKNISNTNNNKTIWRRSVEKKGKKHISFLFLFENYYCFVHCLFSIYIKENRCNKTISSSKFCSLVIRFMLQKTSWQMVPFRIDERARKNTKFCYAFLWIQQRERKERESNFRTWLISVECGRQQNGSTSMLLLLPCTLNETREKKNNHNKSDGKSYL